MNVLHKRIGERGEEIDWRKITEIIRVSGEF